MKWVKVLFALGMTVIPFSGIAGLPILGEISRELSVYFFLPAIFLAFVRAMPETSKNLGRGLALGDATVLNKFILAVCGVIALSALMNGYSIYEDYFRGRHGLEKFFSSLAVLGYGFALSYLTYFVTAEEDWKDLVVKPISVSVILCLSYALVEVVARRYGIAVGLYNALDKFFHTGYNSIGWLRGWDTRIRSVAFEPPALGDYIGFAWPWVYFAYTSSRGNMRSVHAVVLALLNLLLILSGARTALVMLAGIIVVLLFLHYAFLPPNPKPNHKEVNHIASIFIGIMGFVAVLMYFVVYDHVRANVIAGQDISNISRLSSIEAAFNVFKENPLFGVGFGQYGFYVASHIPYWGFYSYELLPKLTYPNEPWPASYMIYARFACEVGIFGLLMWPWVWSNLASQIVKKTYAYFKATGVMLPEAYPLVVSCFCVLLSGITTDTLRTPMIWVSLGLACRYLQDIGTHGQAAIETILAEAEAAQPRTHHDTGTSKLDGSIR